MSNFIERAAPFAIIQGALAYESKKEGESLMSVVIWDGMDLLPQARGRGHRRHQITGGANSKIGALSWSTVLVVAGLLFRGTDFRRLDDGFSRIEQDVQP